MSIVFGTSDEFKSMNCTSKREKNGIVEEDYEYVVTDDTKSNIVMLKVEIDQRQGTVTDEVLVTGSGKQQIFKLPHNARQESIQVTAGDESTYYYKPKTKTLFVTAKTGESGENVDERMIATDSEVGEVLGKYFDGASDTLVVQSNSDFSVDENNIAINDEVDDVINKYF